MDCWRAAALLVAVVGCGDFFEGDSHLRGRIDAGEVDQATAAPTANVGGGDSTSAAGMNLGNFDAGAAGAPSSSGCATELITAKLDPLALAFAFDVSGSMGKGDQPWHDKALKWTPVVTAIETFFEDASTAGTSSSLTFFPGASRDARCDSETYGTPDVPMTPLPSNAFRQALERIEPETSDDWRGGTPTVAVMRGAIAFLRDFGRTRSMNTAIVLVTDGYPQSCGDDDDNVQAVASEAENARAEGISTYVIGVANPPLPDAPDTVSDLQSIAEAGGTQRALVVNTGDPMQTVKSFQEALQKIPASMACSIDVPPAPGASTLDRKHVGVKHAPSAGPDTTFPYDQDCAQQNAWRYEDVAPSNRIVLCDDACAMVQGSAETSLSIQLPWCSPTGFAK